MLALGKYHNKLPNIANVYMQYNYKPTITILFSSSINSIADVYLSLNDAVISNNGSVIINNIGSTEISALICNTNRPVINNIDKRHSGGDWYGPSGTRVGGIGSDDVPGFIRTRGPMVVRLLRNTATDPPSEGIYHCVVEDDTLTEHTLYVGLYYSIGIV